MPHVPQRRRYSPTATGEERPHHENQDPLPGSFLKTATKGGQPRHEHEGHGHAAPPEAIFSLKCSWCPTFCTQPALRTKPRDFVSRKLLGGLLAQVIRCWCRRLPMHPDELHWEGGIPLLFSLLCSPAPRAGGAGGSERTHPRTPVSRTSGPPSTAGRLALTRLIGGARARSMRSIPSYPASRSQLMYVENG